MYFLGNRENLQCLSLLYQIILSNSSFFPFLNCFNWTLIMWNSIVCCFRWKFAALSTSNKVFVSKSRDTNYKLSSLEQKLESKRVIHRQVLNETEARFCETEGVLEIICSELEGLHKENKELRKLEKDRHMKKVRDMRQAESMRKLEGAIEVTLSLYAVEKEPEV